MNIVKKMPCIVSAKYYIFYRESENDHAKLMISSAFCDVIKLTSHSIALELQHLSCPFFCKGVEVVFFWSCRETSGVWTYLPFPELFNESVTELYIPVEITGSLALNVSIYYFHGVCQLALRSLHLPMSNSDPLYLNPTNQNGTSMEEGNRKVSIPMQTTGGYTLSHVNHSYSPGRILLPSPHSKAN